MMNDEPRNQGTKEPAANQAKHQNGSPASPASPTWLSAILRREGELPHGEVLGVEVQGNDAFNSAVSHLVLSYSPDAPPGAPRRLLLKRNLEAAWAKRAGAREAAFYQLIRGLPERLPMIVRCFDAVYDEQSGNSHLLLHDLSSTHRAPLTRDQQLVAGGMAPSADRLRAVVAALAGLHAYWWEHPAMGSGVAQVGAWRKTEAGYAVEIERRAAAWAGLLEGEAGWFPEQHRRLIEHALAGLPRLWPRYLEQRLSAMRALTIVHGDAYFANFLCPIEGTAGETVLIDWQGPEAGRGAEDLVNLCATFWTPALRSAGGREREVLRYYLDELAAHGVRNYGWDQLLEDYRLGLIDWLFVPIQDRVEGSSTGYWWPKLQNLATAYQEWGCAELL